MIRISDKVTNTRIKRLVHLANRLLQDPKFYREIKNKEHDFDMATISNEQVAYVLEQGAPRFNCFVYTYHKKWSKALAYFDPRYPNRIYINTAKLNRSDGSIVATMIHEFVHLVDHYYAEGYFGHGDNSPKGKMNTAPYWIDNLAEHMINGTVNRINNNESFRIVTRKRWWQRLMFWR